MQPYLRGIKGIAPWNLAVTESLATRTLALPFYSDLSREQVEIVASALESSIADAGR